MPASDDDPNPAEQPAIAGAALLYAGLTGACLVTLLWVVSSVIA